LREAMTEAHTGALSPPLERVQVRLCGSLLAQFEQFMRAMGWPAEDAVKILIAYPLAIAKGSGRSQEQVRDDLGAARAELATLRHRAFMADETIRTLEMNVTGFSASIEQFERFLPALEREHASALARFEGLAAEAVRRGVEVEEEVPESVTPQESLLNFFRRHSGAPPGTDQREDL